LKITKYKGLSKESLLGMLNDVKQKSLAEELGVTKQEFSFLLSGKLSSVPTKGIDNYSDFEVKVMHLLGADFTQGNLQI
jgi:hypothetical protein